jgi:hypothetical protein
MPRRSPRDPTKPPRFPALILTLTAISASWLGMMIVHESGHVLAAWLSGGRVTHVVLHPLAFSRTDVSPNPRPLFVVWSGPIWGAALPAIAWLIARAVPLRSEFLLRFFAGFCLIANGAYLASAAVMPAGDTADLLRHGTPLWAIVVPGMAAFIAGLAMWNRLGSHFGFGGQSVDRAAILVSSMVLILLVVGMLIWSAAT